MKANHPPKSEAEVPNLSLSDMLCKFNKLAHSKKTQNCKFNKLARSTKTQNWEERSEGLWKRSGGFEEDPKLREKWGFEEDP